MGSDQKFKDAYYDANRDEINKKRRARYKTDPKVRADANARSKAFREKQQRDGVKRKRKSRKKAIPLETRAKRRRAVMVKKMTIRKDGVDVVVEMVTLGYVAEELDLSIQALRAWETKGILPGALYRDSSGRRLYTRTQARRILVAYTDHYAANRRKLKGSPFQDALHKIWRDMPQGIPR